MTEPALDLPSTGVAAARAPIVPAVVVAIAAVVVRLPFLVEGQRFFNADEAVEGLIARHLLQGEWVAFLWGQHYKGVPEAYLAAPVLHFAGPSVVALKAVTLGLFALYCAVNFLLLARWFSTRIAWLASLYLLVCPPSMVLWSLSASAEVVLTLLAGTVVLWAAGEWRASGSRVALACAAAAFGFGLWVHDYILYYLAAVLLAFVTRPAAWPQLRVSVRTAWVLAAASIVYAGLGLTAFVTGGSTVLGVAVTHPQKLWRVAVALLVLAAATEWIERAPKGGRIARARLLALPLAAFAVGYAPVLIDMMRTGGRSPMPTMDIRGVAASLPVVAGSIVPIVFGFRTPAAARLPLAWFWAVPIAAVLVCSYVAVVTERLPRVLHALPVAAILMFVFGGAFVDTQSYRYLMPIYGALPAVYALGLRWISRRARLAAVTAAVALAALFAVQQIVWLRGLQPDTYSPAAISCMRTGGQRFAYADYWVSYKLVFLTGEQLIVAPTTGVDRYPAYTRAVVASGTQVRLRGPAELDRSVLATSSVCGALLDEGRPR